MIFPLRTNAVAFQFPLVSLALIMANCIVFFVFQLNFPGGPVASIDLWGLTPKLIWSNGEIPGTGVSAWWTLLTPVFLHFDAGHLLGNMVGIWIFGPTLEWLCGRVRFLLLYLGAGVFASVITAALGYASDESGAGASGALAGLMLAFLLIYPRAKVVSWCFLSLVNLLLMEIMPVIRSISVYWYIGFWVLGEVITSWIALAAGMMIPAGAYAHVGGALGGGLLVWSLLIPSRRPDADHHTQTGDLTTVIIGEEGDAAAAPLTEAEQRLAYELSPQGRLEAKIRALRRPFVDTLADSLFASGDLAGVRRHCTEMLELARKDMNPARIEAYEMLLAEITQREAEARQAQAAALRAEQVRATFTAPSRSSGGSRSRSSGYGIKEDVDRAGRRD